MVQTGNEGFRQPKPDPHPDWYLMPKRKRERAVMCKLSVRVTPEEHRLLTQHCLHSSMNMNDLLTKALQPVLRKLKKPSDCS